jgi:hypothetical protein
MIPAYFYFLLALSLTFITSMILRSFWKDRHLYGHFAASAMTIEIAHRMISQKR